MAQVKNENQHKDYKAMRSTATKDFKETNDCGVIATAIAFGVSYKEAHAAYKRAGRKACKGVHYYQIEGAMEVISRDTGIKFKHYDFERRAKVANKANVNRLTFNNVIRGLNKRKSYVVVGIGHMVALKNGRICDWSEGTRHHVENIYEVSR